MLGSAVARAETIPVWSWVYGALRSFELRGLVHLEPEIPYSFDQVEAYTKEIVENAKRDHVVLGPRDAFLLARLTEQFVGMRNRPEDRYDPPVYVVHDADRYAYFDMLLGGSVRKKVDEKKGEGDGLGVPDVLVSLGPRVTLEADYRLVMAPERGSNVRNEKPTARLRSYRGLTAEAERALLDAGGERWEVRVGREYIQWGSGIGEGLIVSRTAGSLDQVSARFGLGPFALSTFQAFLDSRTERHFAGHHLSLALPKGAFVGIGETVVYVRDFDFMYLVPLGSYYAQQFSEESNNDNILWAVDWKVPLWRRFLLYGEFLVDDIQYERDELAGPDKLGLNISAEALLVVGGRELELSAAYTYVGTYTYAHDFGTAYVAGDGDPLMNPILGSSLGPDADRWRCGATLGVSSRATIGAEGVFTRRGEGNAPADDHLLDWRPGLNNDPPFPNGVVLHEKAVSAEFLYDLPKGSYVTAGGGVRFRSGGPGHIDTKDGFGWLEIVLDL
jgi:hypothetical protein